VCDLETSRMGAPYIYDVSHLRVKESVRCLDNIKCQQSATERVCLCSKSITVLSEWTVPKTMDLHLLHFYCIRNK